MLGGVESIEGCVVQVRIQALHVLRGQLSGAVGWMGRQLERGQELVFRWFSRVFEGVSRVLGGGFLGFIGGLLCFAG